MRFPREAKLHEGTIHGSGEWIRTADNSGMNRVL